MEDANYVSCQNHAERVDELTPKEMDDDEGKPSNAGMESSKKNSYRDTNQVLTITHRHGRVTTVTESQTIARRYGGFVTPRGETFHRSKGEKGAGKGSLTGNRG